MNRRILAGLAGAAAVVALTACDTTDNTSYARYGNAISATPDLQFFKDAGAPLLHLDVLCNFGGTLQYRSTGEWSAYDMTQGQTLYANCENWTLNGYRGALSTDWHVSGRPS
jgi:hypothetical protein